MDKAATSFHGLDLDQLAEACGKRAGELQAKAWRNETERNQLRETTADLLSAVAQQLSAVPFAAAVRPPAIEALSTEDLRAIIGGQVRHLPLGSEGPRHAWIGEHEPGKAGDEA